jgi:hypothetical protein
MSVEFTFTTGVSGLLRSSVLPAISGWLQSAKGATVTVDELATALSLPAATQMPTLPSLSGSVPSAAVSSGRGRSSKNTNRPKCTWPLVRGPNRGNPCGKPCTDERSDTHCKTHLEKLLEGGSKPTTTMTAPANPGSVPEPSQSAPQGAKPLRAARIPNSDLLLDLDNRFVLKQEANGVVLVHGVMEQDDKTIRNLTQTEIELACKMNLGVPMQAGSQQSTPVHSPEQVAAPMVPSIPTVGQTASTVPMVPSTAPTVPMVPSTAPTVPMVPSTAPTVPMVPSTAPSAAPTVPMVPSAVPTGVPTVPTVGPAVAAGVPTVPTNEIPAQ